MQDLDKKMIDDFFTDIKSREDAKKELADEMKEAFASFSSSHDLNKKAVTMAYKAWKEYNKNATDFIDTDSSLDMLVSTFIPEYIGTSSQEQ